MHAAVQVGCVLATLLVARIGTGIARVAYLKATGSPKSPPRITLLGRVVNWAFWLPGLLRLHPFLEWPIDLKKLQKEAQKRARSPAGVKLTEWAAPEEGSSRMDYRKGYGYSIEARVLNNRRGLACSPNEPFRTTAHRGRSARPSSCPPSPAPIRRRRRRVSHALARFSARALPPPTLLDRPPRTQLLNQRPLSSFGKFACFDYLMRRLIARLKVVDAVAEAGGEKKLAELAPVKSPVFVLGLPRTGTTFLHRLLSLDPEVCASDASAAVVGSVERLLALLLSRRERDGTERSESATTRRAFFRRRRREEAERKLRRGSMGRRVSLNVGVTRRIPTRCSRAPRWARWWPRWDTGAIPADVRAA